DETAVGRAAVVNGAEHLPTRWPHLVLECKLAQHVRDQRLRRAREVNASVAITELTADIGAAPAWTHWSCRREAVRSAQRRHFEFATSECVGYDGEQAKQNKRQTTHGGLFGRRRFVSTRRSS